MPERFYQASTLLNTYGPLIEPFRGDDLSLRHSRNLQSGIHVFKYCRPRLKDCRGDEEVRIHVFAFSFGFKTMDP